MRPRGFNELDDFNGLGLIVNDGGGGGGGTPIPITKAQLDANQAATNAAFALAQAKVDLDTAKVVALQNKATTQQEMMLALPGYNAGVVPYVAPTPAINAAQAKVDALTVQAAQTAAVVQGLTPAEQAAAVAVAQAAAAREKAAQLAREKAAAVANAAIAKPSLNWWDQMWLDIEKFLGMVK